MATILVVDDHAINRKVLVALLSGDGHFTVEAIDGIDGLRAARTHRPQLVISDILMPSMDGYGFVRALRLDPQLRSIPVIFYTAHYHEREAQRLAEACGVDRVLVKPCPHAEILRAVEQALAGVNESHLNALPDNFDREHLRLLTDKLSERATALAVSNSRFLALAELNLEIASEPDPHALLERVCAGARNLLGSAFAVLAVCEGPATFFCASGIGKDRAAMHEPDLYAGALGQVMSSRLPWRASGVDGGILDAGLPESYPQACAFLCVPLMTPSRVYGWLCLADKVGAARFDADDEKLLLTLGALVSRTYENIRLHAELQRQSSKLNRVYAVLSGINMLIANARNRDELCEGACRLTAERGRFRLAYIEIVESGGGGVALIAAAGDSADVERLSRRGPGDFSARDDLLEIALSSRLPAVCNDLEHTQLRVHLRNELVDRGYRSIAALPLGDGGRTVGRLVLLADEASFFDEAEIRLLSELASGLSVALAHNPPVGYG